MIPPNEYQVEVVEYGQWRPVFPSKVDAFVALARVAIEREVHPAACVRVVRNGLVLGREVSP